jgi:hypothetical protein
MNGSAGAGRGPVGRLLPRSAPTDRAIGMATFRAPRLGSRRQCIVADAPRDPDFRILGSDRQCWRRRRHDRPCARSDDGTGYEDGVCSPGEGGVCPPFRDRASQGDWDAGRQSVQDVGELVWETRMRCSGRREESGRPVGKRRGLGPYLPATQPRRSPRVWERCGSLCRFVRAPLDRGVESC